MPVEPERYELFEPPAWRFTLDRREFLEVAGLLLCAAAEPAAGQSAAAPAARLHLGEDGFVTIFSGKVEVGQGSRTEIAMAAAEELRLPLGRVRVVLADTDLVPQDGITAGSRTTPSTIPAVRQAAAAARELLVDAAARRFHADRAALEVRDGAVADPRGPRQLSYADLAAAHQAPAGSGAPLTPVSRWQILGTPQRHLRARDIVTGAHQYPSDIRRPGMLYGAVLRPPSYGAVIESVDPAAARAPGVTVVSDGAFHGCAAPTSQAARRAVEALAASARWRVPDHPPSSALFEILKRTAREPRENRHGDVEAALRLASRRVQASYRVAYIQHAPMEPRAAVAEWNGARLTVWTGTQNPHGVRAQLAEAFRIPPGNVRVIVPDAGGAFGGKHTGEVAIEAARLARETRTPVSLRWSRAEEFAWAYFRPAGWFEAEAALDSRGRVTAWDFSNYNAGTAAIATPYDIPNTRTRFFPTGSPLREGSYRGIAATANHFARECFMDELAGAASADPLEFRLAHAANPRLRAVLERAAKEFGWGEARRKAAAGRGAGLAAGTEKGSYVAACAEVAIEKGTPRVLRFTMAFECGKILNPSNLLSQVEGSVIQGLGGALTEEIRFENGRLLNGDFARYRVPRFRDVPPLDIHLIDRPDLAPAGAGETPIVAVAPAIANAVFHATGAPPRSMPVAPAPRAPA